MSESSRKITTDDWQNIYNQMCFYNRKEGFVDFVDDKLTFFDSDPQINGVSACYVTIEDVKKWKDDSQ